jgi:signal transduction histidine kinase
MQSAPLPQNEAARLEKLKSYRILDTPSEDAFDRITRIVAETIGVPISAISLIDADRQWFKSKQGLAATQTGRDVAFCAHAILDNDLLIVEDALSDKRFRDNPLVAYPPNIRFYAGAPLRTSDGYNLGTLCAIDSKPRQLTDSHKQLLRDLSTLVIDEMELRLSLRGALSDLAERQKAKVLQEEFLSLVSHEIRSPLTSSRGALGLLESGALGPLSGKMKDIAALASRNANNLLGLVNDLLDFQKLEAGKLEFDFDTADPARLLKEACENMANYSGERKVTIEVEAPAMPPLVCDGARLQQVLVNLLSNAIKFSPSEGKISAAVATDHNTVRFTVRDRGPGIPAEFQPRIFQKFSQADGAARGKGTGLGLALSKIIVEAHRGHIGYETESGKGTLFFFEIPLKASLANP